MASPSTSAAALREEIERLTGAIDRHKTRQPPAFNPAARPRSNVYVNPNYKPPTKQVSRPAPASVPSRPPSTKPPSVKTTEKRDVVIGGVAFESSGRSLVRKDLAVAKPKPLPSRPPLPNGSFAGAKAGMRGNPSRTYQPKLARRGRPTNRNMTLNNNRRPYQPGGRRRKYVDKPCPQFNTTGACTRGLTCPYQHDPAKIAICWPFLQGSCPNTAATCPLSHDPTPQRTPLCVHFANAGRCNRASCPFPHVRVGVREGVCRDFAVLGYCEKGLDCEHQHVRECPDFAEKGVCTTKGCKLPHVIRANRTRPRTITQAAPSNASSQGNKASDPIPAPSVSADSDASTGSRTLTAEDGQLGDEFISLTFHESDSEEDEDDDEEDGSEEGSADEMDEGYEGPSTGET